MSRFANKSTWLGTILPVILLMFTSELWMMFCAPKRIIFWISSFPRPLACSTRRPLWMTNASKRIFRSARSMMRSSTVFSMINRNTLTGFVCPMRWTRSIAWRSTCGFQSESTVKKEEKKNFLIEKGNSVKDVQFYRKQNLWTQFTKNFSSHTIKDDSVGRSQIDSQTTGTCAQKENELVTAACVKVANVFLKSAPKWRKFTLNDRESRAEAKFFFSNRTWIKSTCIRVEYTIWRQYLSIFMGRAAIQSTVLILPPRAVILQDIENSRHLTEYQNAWAWR